MDLKTLFTDDDAVSPVIGVILMVAITVILAAVIGAFVLDLGSSQEKAPQVSFDVDYQQDSSLSTHDGYLTFAHESGEAVNENRLVLSASGGSINESVSTWSDYSSNSMSDGDEVTAGDEVTVRADSGATVSVVWTSESGDTSSQLTNYEVP